MEKELVGIPRRRGIIDWSKNFIMMITSRVKTVSSTKGTGLLEALLVSKFRTSTDSLSFGTVAFVRTFLVMSFRGNFRFEFYPFLIREEEVVTNSSTGSFEFLDFSS